MQTSPWTALMILLSSVFVPSPSQAADFLGDTLKR